MKICLPAKGKVMAEHENTPFGDQCALCEKVIELNFYHKAAKTNSDAHNLPFSNS